MRKENNFFLLIFALIVAIILFTPAEEILGIFIISTFLKNQQKESLVDVCESLSNYDNSYAIAWGQLNLTLNQVQRIFVNGTVVDSKIIYKRQVGTTYSGQMNINNVTSFYLFMNSMSSSEYSNCMNNCNINNLTCLNKDKLFLNYTCDVLCSYADVDFNILKNITPISSTYYIQFVTTSRGGSASSPPPEFYYFIIYKLPYTTTTTLPAPVIPHETILQRLSLLWESLLSWIMSLFGK
jgi:hypothetical protein